MKKKISILLLIVLLSGLINVSALGVEENSYTSYANLLKEVGVFKGTDLGFELNRAPSRIEGGIMFVRLLGGENEALIKHYAHPFLDVPSWANDYVGYLWYYGLTKGISPTEFGSGEIIAKSYITFLLRSLGYDDEAGDFSWSEALNKAQEIGLIDNDLYNDLTSDIFLRDHVAKLSYDVLKQSVKMGDKTLAEKLVEEGALDEKIGVEIGVIGETNNGTVSNTNIFDTLSPISTLNNTEIIELGADGFTGTDLEIAEQILEWQDNNMIYASSSQNYPDVSYSMRWNYAFPNLYSSKDMIDNMIDGNKIYGICYNYAIIYSSIANYYGLEVRVTNTTVKPSEVSDNPFYQATSKGLSLSEYEAFIDWIDTKGLNKDDYPYEAVRLVMAETALHYRAEVKIGDTWTRFDQYDSITEGSTVYDFVVTNWEEGYLKSTFDDYVTRIKNGEDLRGEGYASAYEEFLEGRLIKIETGEADDFVGITDDAGNEHRASNINEVMQGLGLVPYFNNKQDVLDFFENASWVNEEIDELFEIKAEVESQTGGNFYVICDFIIFGEADVVSYDAYSTQYLGFTGQEVPEEVFNNFIK